MESWHFQDWVLQLQLPAPKVLLLIAWRGETETVAVASISSDNEQLIVKDFLKSLKFIIK